MIWLLSVAAGVSILVSALCSASETATFAIGTSRLRTMEEEGFHGATALADLRTRAKRTRATLLFLNTLFSAAVVGTVVLLGQELRPTSGGWWGLLAGSLAVLILGQGIPRLLASRHSIRFALAGAPAVLAIDKVLAAATKPAQRLAAGVARKNGADESTQEERDVRELTQLGQEEGLIGEEEHLLVERYHVSEVVRVVKPTYTKPAPEPVLEGLRFVDGVIEALAD